MRAQEQALATTHPRRGYLIFFQRRELQPDLFFLILRRTEERMERLVVVCPTPSTPLKRESMAQQSCAVMRLSPYKSPWDIFCCPHGQTILRISSLTSFTFETNRKSIVGKKNFAIKVILKRKLIERKKKDQVSYPKIP